MGFLRVREPLVVRHPDIPGAFVALDPSKPYEDTDPIVKAYRWAFGTDEELGAELVAPPVESVAIEQATAAPGEKRARRGR